ncbi:hypothetical protein KKF61_08360 [Patescibacteria group bacterium]|nr:hypothetical protein [Patescibacteria group bacterium]
MATNFPTSLDSYSTKVSGNTIAEGHINDPQDAIEALEAKVGINGSAVATSHDYLLKCFVQGDWILSTVTTARTGWTNVSATYSNKFIRINATPLTTGGADTHTTPSHTLTTAEMPAHTHTTGLTSATKDPASGGFSDLGPGTTASGSTGGGGGHTHTAADNVPAYVQTVIFQKD